MTLSQFITTHNNKKVERYDWVEIKIDSPKYAEEKYWGYTLAIHDK